MIRTLVTALLLILWIAPTTPAQDWAHKLFKVVDHDFGRVAKNARAEFTFEIENSYVVDVHVASVRSSCGCTTPRILKDTITTYEKGAILAVYNTDTFTGSRNATITVTFDRPRFAEVQLTVRGYIRSDVEIRPGTLDFGHIDQGLSPVKTARVHYQGIRDWQLNGVRGSSEIFDAKLHRSKNHPNRYKVVAKLKPDAPVGYFGEELTLSTNDSSFPQLSLRVEGRVVPPIVVSPSALFLGVVQSGQKVTKKIVVRGKEPFRIVSIQPNDDQFSFRLNDTPKKTHIIPVTFTAGAKTAKIVRTIKVTTDLGDDYSVSCQASAAVIESVARK